LQDVVGQGNMAKENTTLSSILDLLNNRIILLDAGKADLKWLAKHGLKAKRAGAMLTVAPDEVLMADPDFRIGLVCHQTSIGANIVGWASDAPKGFFGSLLGIFNKQENYSP